MMDVNELRARMAGLSDDELLKVVIRDRDDYTGDALTVAEEEIRRRGGLDQLRNQRLEKDSAREQAQQTQCVRIAAVKSVYGFPDHVSATMFRWIKYYGMIMVAWLIFWFSSEHGGISLTDVLASGEFWIGIGFLLVLIVGYSVAYSAVTYHKTLEKLVAIHCQNCGKAAVYYFNRIKVKVDEKRFYESRCSRCSAFTRIDLGFAFEATPEQSQEDAGKGDGSLTTIYADHYLGPFKRRKWAITLFPREAVFQSLAHPGDKVVIPKPEARRRFAFPAGEVNLKLQLENSEMKFILQDVTALVDWLPDRQPPGS